MYVPGTSTRTTTFSRFRDSRFGTGNFLLRGSLFFQTRKGRTAVAAHSRVVRYVPGYG